MFEEELKNFYPSFFGCHEKYQAAIKSICTELGEFAFKNGNWPDAIFMSKKLFMFLIRMSVYKVHDNIISFNLQNNSHYFYDIKIITYSSDDFEYHLSTNGRFYDWKDWDII